MVNRDDAREARKRQARRKRIDLARRITHWLIPSPWVVAALVALAWVIVANVRVTPTP